MKILFIGNIKSKFIKDDYNILSKSHKITLVKPIRLFSFVKIFKYIQIARKNDVIYCWWLTIFTASLIGILSHRKVILIAGGYDCVKLKNPKYGAFNSVIKRHLINLNVLLSSYVIFVSKHLMLEFTKNSSVTTNYSVVNLGFNSSEWYPIKSIHRIFDYITVSFNSYSTDYKVRHLIKGIDLFIKDAINNPTKKYLLIGYSQDLLKELEPTIPENLTVMDFTKQSDLLYYYNLSKTYIQCSRFESFGCSPIEAKLCGCDIKLLNHTGILSERNIDISKLTFENRLSKLNKILDEVVVK